MTISGVQEWAASFFSVCPDDETLAAYLDGRLLRIERSGLEAHLAGCGPCVELLATLAPDLRPYLATERMERALRSATRPRLHADATAHARNTSACSVRLVHAAHGHG